MSTKKNGLKSGQKESSDFARNITWFSSSQKNVSNLLKEEYKIRLSLSFPLYLQ